MASCGELSEIGASLPPRTNPTAVVAGFFEEGVAILQRELVVLRLL